MDSFDFDSLDRYIRKFKRNIINKLEGSNFTEKDMKNQSDLLCMVLDYSPKVYDEKKFNKKIEIKPNAFKLDEIIEKNPSIVPLNLNKQTSDDNSYDSSEKGSGAKLSKLSKLSSKIENEFKEIKEFTVKEKDCSIQQTIKQILNDIISDIVENSTNSSKKIRSKNKFKNKLINLVKEKQVTFIENIKKNSKATEESSHKNDQEKHYNSPKQGESLNNSISNSENKNKKLNKNNNNEDEDDSEDEYFKQIESRRQKMEERRNSKNNKKSDDEEEEDDYFKQIENRRQKLEDKRNSKYIKNINNTISHSKFANKLSGTVTIKVYILNTGKSIRLKCGYGDSIKDLKLMILRNIEKDKNIKLKYHTIEGNCYIIILFILYFFSL